MRSFPVPGNGLMLTDNATAEAFASSVVADLNQAKEGETDEDRDR
jgi:hypothetical protein